jgi:hypothetical protein
MGDGDRDSHCTVGGQNYPLQPRVTTKADGQLRVRQVVLGPAFVGFQQSQTGAHADHDIEAGFVRQGVRGSYDPQRHDPMPAAVRNRNHRRPSPVDEYDFLAGERGERPGGQAALTHG